MSNFHETYRIGVAEAIHFLLIFEHLPRGLEARNGGVIAFS
jgi:hypothetical protein